MIVQHPSRAAAEDRGQRPRLQSTPAPSAEDEAADCEIHEWSAHVDQDERPRIGFKRREDSDGSVLDEKKREPANHRDLQSSDCIRRIEASDQPSQGIIHNDRGNDCEEVSANAMRALDIRHRSGVQIKPLFAEHGVPAPADNLMNNNQDPNCEMIDLSVHETLRIMQASEVRLQTDCATGRLLNTYRSPPQ